MIAGKKGSKDKGKGFAQKGPQKGKSKGKFKSKSDGKSSYKGKQKGDGKGKSGGKQNDNSSYKGKGGMKSDQVCHRCGKQGHFARDCWSPTVRHVQGDFQQQPQQQIAQSSPSSAAGASPASGNSQVQGGQQQQGQQSTQYRVARIHEFSPCQIASDVQKHDEVVFDLRSPVSNSSGQGGSVRVARFYIGDGPSNVSDGSVRAVVESMPEGSDLCNILLDSGADASIFPASMSGFGLDSETPANRLQDAQGNSIPIDGMKDIEVHLMDQHGRSVVLKETVEVSSQITQPILCFGHLLENGWGVNGREQTLVHGSGISVPIQINVNQRMDQNLA